MANFSMENLLIPDYMVTLGFVVLLGFFFAKLEIAIEGDAGWAANLPTWRIEKHWLLDLFWGGREMTGYHAWAFSLIALFFHFPLIFSGEFSWAAEQRALASIMLFWVSEDFLWFVLNPAFGLRRFEKTHAGWHRNWWMGAPIEYWIFTPLGLWWMYSSYQ
ncbi:MAG: hypothetical protein NTZ96_10370 [Burkholderiales bacterium]|nr:hypothetical protein [Burkholderiales bacterium]